MTTSPSAGVPCHWFFRLASALDPRSAPRLACLFVGAILARGRRTVTSWIRAAGLSDDYRPCYATVAAAGKKSDLIAAHLAHGVVKPLVAGADRLTFAIDDTPTERYGRHVQGAGVHHNPTPGPAGGPFVYGHVWVVLGLLATHPTWGIVALPVLARLTVVAPLRMTLDTVRVFAISKLAWIRQQQKKIRDQDREPPREYLDRESHYVWGKRYLLAIVERDAPPSVELCHSTLELGVRPGTPTEKRAELLDAWYRGQIRQSVPPLVGKWELLMGVKVSRFFVQRMRTRWGSCNTAARSIRLNTDLALKPRECLEYIVVHELCHLIEPTHNARFVALMNRFLPHWQSHRSVLNRLPVRHEEWDY